MASKKLEMILEFRLREVMESKNISIAELSARTGLTRGALYFMLDHLPRAITFNSIARLCHGLGVTPSDLFIVRSPKVK